MKFEIQDVCLQPPSFESILSLFPTPHRPVINLIYISTEESSGCKIYIKTHTQAYGYENQSYDICHEPWHGLHAINERGNEADSRV